MNEVYEIERSPLCQDIAENGKKVRVEIYRGGGSNWHLEVVDDFGNSTVWDDQFPTDVEALEEARATIEIEGIGGLIGNPT